ncbi:uncharacterized protein N7484_007732 [Penicillium longicatenatum]|uniref:uncharacterized protein n=1 Tax=Penicillium longicatenatum TaxID=1561947 RepID=UPI0025490930|nr:uncharacterized protein N7484_007732 [Penicillium longicatenatum]KAJ5639870.1 hypothetical protein N7484_007732 [Penicillium longicatenatum]
MAASFDWNTAIDTVEVTGDILHCTSNTGAQGHINVTNIIGVVPSTSLSGYQVLFLVTGENVEELGYLENTAIPSLPSALSPYLVKLPDHLRLSEPVQVIISTLSGTGSAQTVFRDILEPFLSHLGVSYQAHETQSSQTISKLSLSRFLERACAGIPQTIILLSGDGGLVDILDVFYQSNRPIQVPPRIALIPCGTGNAMASSIGLRSGPASSLAALLRGEPSPVPIFAATLSPGSQLVVDEGRQRQPLSPESDVSHQTVYGAVVASWGLHAALVADSDTVEYRKFGSERFKMAAKELLYPSDGAEPHRFRGKITYLTVDGQKETIESDEHMYVLASLVPRLEKDFLISPESEPLGEQMRFLRFGPLPAEEAMRLMTLAYQGGQHVQEAPVTYAAVEQVRIEFQEDLERWRRVCIDGKIVVVEKGGWLELRMEPRRLLQIIKP